MRARESAQDEKEKTKVIKFARWRERPFFFSRRYFLHLQTRWRPSLSLFFRGILSNFYLWALIITGHQSLWSWRRRNNLPRVADRDKPVEKEWSRRGKSSLETSRGKSLSIEGLLRHFIAGWIGHSRQIIRRNDQA